MKSQILFPNRVKKVGWWLLIPSVIVGVWVVVTGYTLGTAKDQGICVDK